eukprot:1248106-Rhodomonas_salina.1
MSARTYPIVGVSRGMGQSTSPGHELECALETTRIRFEFVEIGAPQPSQKELFSQGVRPTVILTKMKTHRDNETARTKGNNADEDDFMLHSLQAP